MFLLEYKYYKWFALIPGWVLGGFIGAIASFFLVKELMDNKDQKISLELALLKLASLLIKADGKVHNDEVKLVQQYFKSTFGFYKSNKLFRELKNRSDVPSNIGSLSLIIRNSLNPSKLYAIIQFLYGLSAVDGQISDQEEEFIFNVGFSFGYSPERLNSIKNQFIKSKSNPKKYTKEVIDALLVLGLIGDVEKDEIKKAYRNLAKEYHPDKLSGMSEGIINLAKEKFQLIQQSYEYLTKHYVKTS